jgi:hypothetical protein
MVGAEETAASSGGREEGPSAKDAAIRLCGKAPVDRSSRFGTGGIRLE